MTGHSHGLSRRYRLFARDANLARFARLDRDRGAVGHNAQRRLHAMQTLFQLSYSPTTFVLYQSRVLSERESTTVDDGRAGAGGPGPLRCERR